MRSLQTQAQRDKLLPELTDEIAQHVLRDNYDQTLALSIAQASAPSYLDDHMRMIRDLERRGLLDRGVEGLPSDDDARSFFAKHWRFFETNDRGFAHMTPIQGNWTIDGIGLPADVLRRIYFDNARGVLARAWPVPALRAKRVGERVALNGMLRDPAWANATPIVLS